MDRIDKTLASFVKHAVTHLESSEHISSVLMEHIDELMSHHTKAAIDELDKLCADIDGPPMTYNHYYSDNVQNDRNNSTKRRVEEGMEAVTHGDTWRRSASPAEIVAALQPKVVVGMGKQACSEARIGLRAYYKVACKTFVDNVCVQVIERHLLRNLAKVFSPEFVAGISDEDLQRIAGEHEGTIAKRQNLQEMQQALKTSLSEMRK